MLAAEKGFGSVSEIVTRVSLAWRNLGGHFGNEILVHLQGCSDEIKACDFIDDAHGQGEASARTIQHVGSIVT